VTRVGLLHPGQMGAALGAALRAGGTTVLWASDGRSDATAHRAASEGLEDAGTLAALVAASDVVVSICPPAAAADVAAAVAAEGFTGPFLEANAIAPARAVELARLLPGLVDGAVIGPPPRRPGTSRLYLAGDHAGALAALFADGPLEAVVLPGEVGSASALKMAFGGFNKGALALAAQAQAIAARYGVERWLAAEGEGTGYLDAPERLGSAAAKAWRWAPEMDEVAATCAALGLPDGLPRGAAALFERWAARRDEQDVAVAEALRDLAADTIA
jgi:3-hydroxyisobutyrate dehydrogenase-like beta-hydroxyacid dehydrogenase